MSRFKEFLLENDEDWNVKFAHIKAFFDQAQDLKQLTKLKKEANRRGDADTDGSWKFGPIEKFAKAKREQLKSKLGLDINSNAVKDSRMDRLLRIRDSSGKATARR